MFRNTEHRLTSPPQLTRLRRLDQDMKTIMDSSLAEDQKVILLDQLLRRYQGLSKQMKSEVTVKPALVLPKLSSPNETAMDENSSSLTTDVKPTRKEPRKLPATPVTPKPSKSPRRIGAMSSLSPGVAYDFGNTTRLYRKEQ